MVDPITPLTPTAADADTSKSEPKGDSKPAAAKKPNPVAKDLDMEQLLTRNRQLEAENRKLEEKADGLLNQFEALKARGPVPVELKTTTTKPTLRFEVSGDHGILEFDVVDESEAKRLYCAAKQVDPSAVVLKVKCLDQDKRNPLIYEQYENGGYVPERIPSVDAKFLADKRRTAKTAAAVG